MKELDRKINLWIRERLIPQLTENEFDATFTITRPTGTFFLSDLFFVTAHMCKSGNKSVAVKLPPENIDRDIKIINNYVHLFDNEILFYNQIACGHEQDYPKCYIAGEDSIFKNAIVLEDVRQRGYTVSPKKVNVDLDYAIAGLKSIARFHGHTYAIKEKEPARFHKIVRSIVNYKYTKNPKNEDLQKLINNAVHEVLRALREKHHDPEFTGLISNVLEDAFGNVILRCVEPVEPLATIVHGDCTINNLLYRKKHDGELESMLIDFGTLMYSSPVTDVAVFLYLTCKREDIRDRSEDLITVYHDSLMKCLKEHGIWDPKKYSRQAFWQEYRERAVYGYAGAAVLFRCIMEMYERDNGMPDLSYKWNERFLESEEGQDFIDRMIDMLNDLRVAGMLDHLIKK